MSEKPKILVLDDQMLIGFEIASALERSGFSVVGPFADVDAALDGIAEAKPDAALLDINMGDGTTSEPLADALMEQNLPFAFLTSYGSADAVPPRFSNIHMMSKPFRSDALVSLASRLIGKAA